MYVFTVDFYRSGFAWSFCRPRISFSSFSFRRCKGIVARRKAQRGNRCWIRSNKRWRYFDRVFFFFYPVEVGVSRRLPNLRRRGRNASSSYLILAERRRCRAFRKRVTPQTFRFRLRACFRAFLRGAAPRSARCRREQIYFSSFASFSARRTAPLGLRLTWRQN